MNEDVDFFVSLEREIFEGLVSGDTSAEYSLLADDFVGIYGSGRTDKAGHASQLAHGPSLSGYSIERPQLKKLSDDLVYLTYLTRMTNIPKSAEGAPEVRTYYETSIWQRRGERWVNVLTQGTEPSNVAGRVRAIPL